MPAKHEITPADILAMDAYAKVRRDRRQAVREMKRNRRIAIGPDAMAYFENYDTMLHQVHEMLFIEKGGADQIPGELEAYNPLIPKGRELVATIMFEIDNPDRRAKVLASLGGVEEAISISVDGETVPGAPESDSDRTNAQGKASSVQFIRFTFTAAQIAKFRQPDAKVTLAIVHRNYAHSTVIAEPVRAALAEDFD